MSPFMSLHAYIVSVQGPPRPYCKPLKLLYFDFNADPSLNPQTWWECPDSTEGDDVSYRQTSKCFDFSLFKKYRNTIKHEKKVEKASTGICT
jgi:hypothetical protein